MFTFDNIQLELTDTYFKVVVKDDFLETMYFKPQEKQRYVRLFTALVETALLNKTHFLAYYTTIKKIIQE